MPIEFDDREVVGNIDSAIRALEQRIRGAAVDAGETLERRAKENAPVLSGELRRSIVSKQRSGPDGGEVEVSANTPYAAAVEFGSVHNPKPQPFMRRAIQETRSAASAIFRRI